MFRSNALQRLACWGAGVLVMIGTAATARAGGSEWAINIELERPIPIIGNVPDSTYGAAANSPGIWNLIRAADTAVAPLTLTSGAASGCNFRQYNNGNGGSASSCVSGISTLGFQYLMCDYAQSVVSVPDPLVYDISNLPGGVYEVFVYTSRPGLTGEPTRIVNFAVNGTSLGNLTASGDVLTSIFQEGRTHVRRVVSVPNGATLKMTLWAGGGEFGSPVACNGMQIRRIDEPDVEITSPSFQECVCSPVEIVGTVTEGSWRLEYSSTGNDPWTEIAEGTNQVFNNTLATWDASGLPEGLYAIRLSSIGPFSNEATAFTVAYLNQQFTSFNVTGPGAGSVLGGDACIGGTIWDECFSRYFAEYAPSGSGSYQPVDPAFPFYTSTIINQTGAVWDTTGVADGDYNLRVRAFDDCHPAEELIIPVTVDNTPPTAQIISPTQCEQFCGQVLVIGTANDANLSAWALQYSTGNGWVTINSGNTPVINGVLANWDTTSLPKCAYTLRLVVSDQAIRDCNGVLSNNAEATVSVIVAPQGDLTFDGMVNIDDLNVVLSNWLDTCN